MNFNEFVCEQVDRLGAIPEFTAKITEAGRLEMAQWLEEQAKEPAPKRKRTGAAEWIRESQGAQKVKAIIDDALEFTSPPGLAMIKSAWLRKNPPPNELRKNCTRCDGTGFIVVEGPYGTSAAYPCSHKPETDADRRMGVPIAPAVEAMYKREAIEAEENKRKWQENPRNPMNKFTQERG